MHLVVGLGNPGKKYEKNRHNVGFMAVERLARGHALPDFKEKFSGVWTKGELVIGGARHPVALLEPQTFMNLSGGVLVQYARRPFWSATIDLLVLVDDVAIPAGSWRFRPEGGAGGHNGLKSIDSSLGTQKYPRLRIGVGDPGRAPGGPLTDFVLGAVGKREGDAIRGLFDVETEAVEAWVRDGNKGALDVQSRVG